MSQKELQPLFGNTAQTTFPRKWSANTEFWPLKLRCPEAQFRQRKGLEMVFKSQDTVTTHIRAVSDDLGRFSKKAGLVCIVVTPPPPPIYRGGSRSEPNFRLTGFYCNMSLTYRDVFYEYWKGVLSIGKGKVSDSNTSYSTSLYGWVTTCWATRDGKSVTLE